MFKLLQEVTVHLSGTLKAEFMFFTAKIKEAFLHIQALLAGFKPYNAHRLLGLTKQLPQNKRSHNKCSNADKLGQRATAQICSFKT